MGGATYKCTCGSLISSVASLAKLAGADLALEIDSLPHHVPVVNQLRAGKFM